jgi:nucleotide-binding universal stress UspA family protein
MTIVVGYLPKPEGHAAVECAIEEAQARGDNVIVINTSRGDAPIDNAYAEDDDLDVIRAALKEAGVDHEVRRIVPGLDTAEEIVAAATQTGARLVVIGLRRRTAVGKFIMGSTAQQILFEAPCPVLAVKAGSKRMDA